MADRIYLGTILGEDAILREKDYFEGVFGGGYALKLESLYFDRRPTRLLIDGDYIYITTADTLNYYGYVYKYKTSDFSLVATSPKINCSVRSIAIDNEYIYVTGSGSGSKLLKVWKLSKQDLSIIAESFELSYYVYADVAVDDNYIYVINGNKLYKLNKSDLSEVANTNRSRNLTAIVLDDDYVYIAESYYSSSGDNQNVQLHVISKADLSLIQTVTFDPNYTDINKLISEDNFIYVAVSKYVYIVDKSTYNKSTWLLTTSGSILSLAMDNKYVYVGSNEKLLKYFRQNKELLATTEYSLGVHDIVIDDSYVYISLYNSSSGRDGYVYKLEFLYQLLGYRRVKQ